MLIVNKYPPNIKKIKRYFNLEGQSPVFAYGNIIFNPNTFAVSPGVMVHERVHSIQQQGYKDTAIGWRRLYNKFFVSNVDQWWNRYLTDREFLIMEEMEAYAYQYKAFCDSVADRNKRAKYLEILAKNLSGGLYGNIMSYNSALSALRNGTKNLING